jgi:adenosylhomocysteinase
VGRDIVQAIETEMRSMGITLTWKKALVVGYGMIGVNTARALKASNFNVLVYDKRDHRNLAAFMDGYTVNKKSELLRMANIIICATGWSSKSIHKQAITLDEVVKHVNNNALLASAGSQDNEFNFSELKKIATGTYQVTDHVTQFHLPDKKTVFVINNGTAVNFLLPSIPVQILDLVFSEIVLGAVMLMNGDPLVPVGKVNETEEKYWDLISKNWLLFNNS